MKTYHVAQVIGVPLRVVAERSPKMLQLKPSKQYNCTPSPNRHLAMRQTKFLHYFRKQSIFRYVETVFNGISEAFRRNLSPPRILWAGRMGKIFNQNFNVREGEKLLNFFQCYLSTTAGLIKGHLFISTDRVAFCSDKSIKFQSPNGELIRMHYKVSIPVGKIFQANESNNMNMPSQKYVQIVTVDDFDFWFMGFSSYQKTLKYLYKSVFQLSQ